MVAVIDYVDPSCCPLCGKANQCGLQACGTSAAQFKCWCQEVVVDAGLLRDLPESVRGKSCICRSCAQQGQLSTDAVADK